MAEVWFRTQPSRPLQFLTCVTGRAEAADLPSWVPDWREKWKSQPLAQVKLTGNGACGDLQCAASFPALSSPIALPLRLVVGECRCLL